MHWPYGNDVCIEVDTIVTMATGVAEVRHTYFFYFLSQRCRFSLLVSIAIQRIICLTSGLSHNFFRLLRGKIGSLRYDGADLHRCTDTASLGQSPGASIALWRSSYCWILLWHLQDGVIAREHPVRTPLAVMHEDQNVSAYDLSYLLCIFLSHHLSGGVQPPRVQHCQSSSVML